MESDNLIDVRRVVRRLYDNQSVKLFDCQGQIIVQVQNFISNDFLTNLTRLFHSVFI